MVRLFVGAIALSAVLVAAGQAQAQRPGGGGFGGGGFGGDWATLLRNDAVLTEIEAQDDQKEKINEILREGRGERGQAGDFRNLSDAERAERREQATARAAETRKKIEGVLLPHQTKRLQEISIQVRGVQALTDDAVAKQLNITEQQKEQVQAKLRETAEGQRERLREIFQGGNREDAREQLTQIRAEAEKNVLSVLSEDQRKKFEEMKGEAFEMPRPTFGRGGAGAGQPGGRTRQPGQQGQRGGRRPAGDTN